MHHPLVLWPRWKLAAAVAAVDLMVAAIWISVVAALYASGVATPTPEEDQRSYGLRLVTAIILAPLSETLVLVCLVEWLRPRVVSLGLVAALAAFPIALAHLSGGWHSGVASMCAFWLQGMLYLELRRRGEDRWPASQPVIAVHAVHNGVVLLAAAITVGID